MPADNLGLALFARIMIDYLLAKKEDDEKEVQRLQPRFDEFQEFLVAAEHCGLHGHYHRLTRYDTLKSFFNILRVPTGWKDTSKVTELRMALYEDEDKALEILCNIEIGALHATRMARGSCF